MNDFELSIYKQLARYFKGKKEEKNTKNISGS